MKKKVCMAAALVLVACLCLTACGEGYFRATYEGESGAGDTIDFYKDGTMEICQDGVCFEGTYERIEKNTYNVRIDAIIMTLRYTVVKEKDTITITDNSGDEHVYTQKK